MPKLPVFRLRSSEPPTLPDLQYRAIALALSNLQLGVDNLRYDVFLSSRVTADLSFHLARYICRFGEVESLFEMDVPVAHSKFISAQSATKLSKPGPTDLKALLVSIHLAILNRAKSENNPSVDVLGRLAVFKFLRTELNVQFARILEQCHVKSKSLEGVRQVKMMQTQELVSSFRVRKKIILRRAGYEVFRLIGEIEKETDVYKRQGLERVFWKQIQAANWVEVERALSSNYAGVTPAGGLDREAALEQYRTWQLKAFSIGDLKTELNGNTIVVTYTITLNGAASTTSGSQPLPSTPQHMMTVWQQQKSGWVEIAHSVSQP